MKSRQLFAGLALALAAAVHANAQDDEGYDEFTIRASDIPRDAPRFNAYQVPVYTGVNASPKLNADAETRISAEY